MHSRSLLSVVVGGFLLLPAGAAAQSRIAGQGRTTPAACCRELP